MTADDLIGKQILDLARNNGALNQRVNDLEAELKKLREHVTETMRVHIKLQHPDE